MPNYDPITSGFANFFRKLFHLKLKEAKPFSPSDRNRKLEPRYWQETIDFITTLKSLIDHHTIHDANVQQINQRIVDYIETQINIKGSIPNLNDRYNALNIYVDRLLSNTFNKIVGLKKDEIRPRADFTLAVEKFKQRLQQRRQEEMSKMQ